MPNPPTISLPTTRWVTKKIWCNDPIPAGWEPFGVTSGPGPFGSISFIWIRQRVEER